MTRVMTADPGLAHRLRAALAPRVLGRRSVQARLGRGVGMLDTAYRNGVLSAAGRRMPDPELRDGGRLHQRLGALGHTWVTWVGPDEPPPDPADSRWHGLPVLPVTRSSLAEGQPWPDDTERVVLVRPDRHVAAAGRTSEAVWSVLQHHTTCGPPAF